MLEWHKNKHKPESISALVAGVIAVVGGILEYGGFWHGLGIGAMVMNLVFLVIEISRFYCRIQKTSSMRNNAS
jgi:hypothetical protein